MPGMRPTIVLDSHIPEASDIFSRIGRVISLPGPEIGPEVVKKADILVVRSITQVGENLLSGSSVQFVGTATAGIDHLDTEYLSAKGIEWANAPGANAESVVEYTIAAMSVIASRGQSSWQDKTLGVVGCGQVGERLCQRAESIGMRVLRNDPPRAQKEGGDSFVDLQNLVASSDIVSVHVPLETSGLHPTWGLLDKSILNAMKPSAWLIQSSRGGTVDEAAAVSARAEGRLGALVLDVFENEPSPDPATIEMADLATGHIAGYSRDAKRQGVLMIRDAALRHLGVETSSQTDEGAPLSELIAPVDKRGLRISPEDPQWLDGITRQVMDIRDDDRRFRDVIQSSDPVAGFHRYRADYPPRYSWSRYVASGDDTEKRLLASLGFQVR